MSGPVQPVPSSSTQAELHVSQNRRKDFNEGAIVRIKLENILTYESVEFYTSPYLNVIIGPNGTGKSTIICAICLGLGGKTSLLGRASQLSEYIRYGKSKGSIEIELFNPDGDNYVIHREISKNNMSVWYVNGRSANLKAVEEMTVRLRIQVGNLCQFLPQEKVADFSRMSQQELLENTEKAVGSEKMYETHMILKQARSKARNLMQSYDSLVEHLNQEKQKNNHLEQDVENFEEGQRYLEQIEMMKMKKPWLEYEEQRRKYTEIKKVRDEMSKDVEELQTAAAPKKKELQMVQNNLTKTNQQLKNITACIMDTTKSVEKLNKGIETETDKATEVLDDLKYKKQEEEQNRKSVRDLKRHVGTLESQLASIPTNDDNQPAIEQINMKIQQVSYQLNELHTHKASLQSEIKTLDYTLRDHVQSLQRLHDISNIRLQSLREKHKHTYMAVQWLRENSGIFSGTVHEPIMLNINMKNPSDAKFIESFVSFNDLRSFVCENANDMDLLLSKIRDEQKLKINCVKCPAQELSYFQPRIPIDHLKKYGFRCFLKDLFDCPEGVMKFLCMQYKVHLIPVGNDESKSKVDQIIHENPSLNIFFTANNQYSIKTSRYSGQKSTRNHTLRDANLLKNSSDIQKEKWLKEQIQASQHLKNMKEGEISQLQHQCEQHENSIDVLRKEKKFLMQQKDTKRRLLSEITSKKNKIHQYKVEAIDLVEEENKTQAIVHQITWKKIKLLKELLLNISKCFDMSKNKVHLSLEYCNITQKKVSIEESVRETTHNLQRLLQKFEECKDNIKSEKDLAKRLLDIAQKATNTEPKADLSEYYRREFTKYPESIQDIDNRIHSMQARADCRFQTDERVVQEYYERKKSIEVLELKIQCKKVDVENHQDQIDEAKKLWLEPLNNLIGKINENFSQYFSSMDCAGEVDLLVPDNKEDFEKYGIRIKVKFRDGEQMLELSQNIQSGGERSISTVLYLMALQDLAVVPFRCVDEINQGMDPINERRVFKIVVDAVCKKRTSQYFLLTPKLLPDLNYHDDMSVLCVYNGPSMLHHKEWYLHRFLRRRKRLLDES
ncbi:structural maintenance of chromosomes protein 5-like [Argonauta hians]